jgi:hypothetical protein
MFISFMEFSVNFQRWDTLSEARKFLGNINCLVFDLTNDIDFPYYTISIEKNFLSYKMGILGKFQGIQPTLLLSAIHKKIVLICGMDMFIIDVSNELTQHHYKNQTLLYSVIGLDFLGIVDYFLVIAELNVFVMGFNGVKLWEFELRDLITDWLFEDDHLTIIVEEEQFHLDYRSGLIVN